MNFNLSSVDSGITATTSEIVKLLGFDSMSHYQFCHFFDIDRDYNDIMVDVLKNWEHIEKTCDISYFLIFLSDGIIIPGSRISVQV